MSVIVVEGPDRLGKDSLIQGIIRNIGYHQLVHFSKPLVPNCYSDDPKEAAFEYQKASFVQGFNNLCIGGTDFIYNRSFLGEYVYAPRYRDYDGSYVFQIEYDYRYLLDNMRLILLYTDNFEFLVDDGKSFNFEKRGEEMSDFITAFNRSIIPHKVMINVHDGHGGYRPFDDILTEALTFLKETKYQPSFNII